jgi:hypothetical protein
MDYTKIVPNYIIIYYLLKSNGYRIKRLELVATFWVIKVTKVERKYHMRIVKREVSENAGYLIADFGLRIGD